MKYQVLEHTADLKIRAFGKTKQGLFKNMMIGMQTGLRPKFRFRVPSFSTKIKIESENLEALLIDFLNEINYLNEINLAIYKEIYFEEFSDTLIQAEILGKKIKRFGLQIKGATFHDLDIHEQENGIWQATVLFDI